MRQPVLYTPYATYQRGKTGNIITFSHFEEGNLLSEMHNLFSENLDNTESGNKSDNYTTMLPLMSGE